MASSTTATLFLVLFLVLFIVPLPAQRLRRGFYDQVCPGVETVVAQVMATNFKGAVETVTGAIRLILHDCFVEGCDASIMIQPTGRNQTERDHPDNLSIVEQGFLNIVEAKKAIDATPGCTNKVSCADIVVMATREAIALVGGPSYPVELGRLDGLSSTTASVDGNLPGSFFNLDQLLRMFAANNLSQTDMVALSGAHTIGFSHCNQFARRVYNFSHQFPVDPSMNKSLVAEIHKRCRRNDNPGPFVPFDPETPVSFDSSYFRALQQGRGLLASDQVLHTDPRSRPTVDRWAGDSNAFNEAFVEAITKMARIGVKTRPEEGNIRADCTRFNSI